MSFLAPLYVLGALAIGLPILFHLIRRTPQKKQVFSSLMFLTPSPPRLTRRSRLTNILLLLLRALALALLAFAFARPFFYRHEDLNVNQAEGRRIALLVDTSASMRRGDLWDQAKKQVDQVTRDLAPSDEVLLFLFDRTVRPALPATEWNELELSRRVPLLRSRLDEAQLTWAATNLGEALSAVADQLAEAHAAQKSADTTRRQIVLISDLQAGSHVAALQGHEWPENVLLDVKPLTLKQSTNAALQTISESTDSPVSDGKLRVRVSNAADSTREGFSIAWANERGLISTIEPQKVYVTPGRNQIVRVTPPPTSQPADRLVLQGDDFDFDNTLFVTVPQPDVLRVVYLGDDAPEDAKGLTYYLASALGETSQRKIELVLRRTTDKLLDPDLSGSRLVVITSGLSEDRVPIVRKHLEAGGDALWVLRDVNASNGLAKLMQLDNVKITEAAAKDFALLARIEMEHPLFAPFADARFSDFTKIHFWKHRTIMLPDPQSAHVLATFDNGDPFLIEKSIGQGNLRVMTSGWEPVDSQLALSTKFVPLMNGLVQKRDNLNVTPSLAVGDAIALPPAPGAGKRTVRTPDGKRFDIVASEKTFGETSMPGIYDVSVNDQHRPVAVNLAADESRTTPLAAADLEQWGAKLGEKAPPEVLVARQRELKFFELENRQKMWRWLIVVVLGLLAIETALAGKLARRSTVPSGVTT